MGVRGEIFSEAVQLDKRTYFFNVKENRLGDLYLNIVESRNKKEGGFDRQSIILFAEDLQEFLSGMDAALKVMEKADREQQKARGGGEGKKKVRYSGSNKKGALKGREFQEGQRPPRGGSFQDGRRPPRRPGSQQGKVRVKRTPPSESR